MIIILKDINSICECRISSSANYRIWGKEACLITSMVILKYINSDHFYRLISSWDDNSFTLTGMNYTRYNTHKRCKR